MAAMFLRGCALAAGLVGAVVVGPAVGKEAPAKGMGFFVQSLVLRHTGPFAMGAGWSLGAGHNDTVFLE